MENSELPGISCFCSTYGRPRYLIENSIKCFLDQDYRGPKELVILNDFSDQELIYNHPEVRIFNSLYRIKPLGRKFNENVALCRYPLIAVWEDDDFFLRHRLSFSLSRMKNGIYHSHDAFFERNLREIELSRNYYHSQHLFSRALFDRVGGYDESDQCSIDLSIMNRFRGEVGDYSQPIENVEDRFYVYVWSAAGSFHGSGMGITNDAISDSAALMVAKQVAEGQVETGRLRLEPRLRYDVYQHLPTSASLYRPENVRIEYGLPASGKVVDVTSRVAALCADSKVWPGYFVLPPDDVARARIFGDPAPNVLKDVIIKLPLVGSEQFSDNVKVPATESCTFAFKNGELAFRYGGLRQKDDLLNEFNGRSALEISEDDDFYNNNSLRVFPACSRDEALIALKSKYYNACQTVTDISQHIPLLLGYAKQCSSIVECGVRYLSSSYAFALGLVGKIGSKYTLIDPFKSTEVESFISLCGELGVQARFLQESDLQCPVQEADLLFIDTWHVYGQLRRELDRWQSSIRKFIILHDTTTDGLYGESIRNGSNIKAQSEATRIPEDEISKGIWPAVEEFLLASNEWCLDLKLENSNGVTVLKRA